MESPNDLNFSSQSQQVMPTELIPLPGCKSQFWRYFGFYSHAGQIIESKKRVVVCKLCLREMAYSGNTSNLSSHLNSRHPREFAAAKALSHVDRSSTRYVTSTNPSTGCGGGGSGSGGNTTPTADFSVAAAAAAVAGDASFFKLPKSARHSPSTTSSSSVTTGLLPASSSSSSAQLTNEAALNVKKEALLFSQFLDAEISTNSSPSSLSGPPAPSSAIAHSAYQSPAEEALVATAVDLLLSPKTLLTSAPFLDFCHLLEPNFNPPPAAQLSVVGLYHRVRDAVFPVRERQCEEAFYALSIELDHLLHGRHGTATAQRVVLHRLDADFNGARITLQASLSQLHADPLAWGPHIRAIVAEWELAPGGLFGLVLAGTWVEGAKAACLDNIRTRLPQPQFLSLETSLARVIASAVDATGSKEFVSSAICAMNADARNESAKHQDNLLPEWCRLCHYLRDGPLSSIKAGRILLAFMAPLEAVYLQLRNEERVHLSVVRPLVALMEKQLASAGGAEIDEMQDWSTLRSQWTNALRVEFDSGDGYLVATLLDPRFKSLPFVSESDRRVFHEQLKRKAYEEAPNVYPVASSSAGSDAENGGPPSKKTRTSTEVLLSELFSSSGSMMGSQKCSTTVEDKAEREISNYLNEEDLPLDGNPLAWWRTKKSQYPLLSLLARKYFCLPGLMSHRASFLEAQTRLPHLEESTRPMMSFLKEYQDWIGVVRELT